MTTMLYVLSSFFQSDVGQYWIYMYIGAGVAMCLFIIFDNLKK